MRHRDVEVLDERAQGVEAGPAAQAAAQVDQRSPRGHEQVGDLSGDAGRQPRSLGRGEGEPGRGVSPDGSREMVHRHAQQDRAGASGRRGPEGALGEPGQVGDPVDLPGPLHERPVDGRLVAVGVQVDLLVRVPAPVVRRDVTGDRDEGHGVESSRQDAGDGVGHAGSHV
jgi:hypothetical protein